MGAWGGRATSDNFGTGGLAALKRVESRTLSGVATAESALGRRPRHKGTGLSRYLVLPDPSSSRFAISTTSRGALARKSA